MDQKELFDRLEELEWEDFEVKEAKTSIPKSSFETVSAFSNTNGGWLEKLQVVVDGKITIGGMLVFGNEDNINRMLTDFRVDYLEIMGTSYSDAPTRYNYRLYEEENLFRFYFSIFERLMKKIDLPFTLRADGFATDSQPQLVAIREALVNLLMHSDYFSPMKPRISNLS